MLQENHEFGGRWTEDKLQRITKYLQAYTSALKNQPFQLMYVDAFAGTGYRATKRPGETVRGFFPLPQATLLARGSARRALEVEPAFNKYVFIEANPGRFRELRKLEVEYPGRRDRMRFRNEEANAAIIDTCRGTVWRKTRAVMFLDPYGMQVDWTTVEEVARAQHIDMWYLFPVGAVHRLLHRQGRIRPEWELALERILGHGDWRCQFYKPSGQLTFFGDLKSQTKVADVRVIEAYVRDRLVDVFQGGVAKNALQASKFERKLHVPTVLCMWQSEPQGAPVGPEDRGEPAQNAITAEETMAASDIEWTESTWNPIAGCTMVSPGCTNCYAMRLAARLETMGNAKYQGTTRRSGGRSVWSGRLNMDDAALQAPLGWSRPQRIFVNSMSDLFHDDIPITLIRSVWEVMARAYWHTFQILTKRPSRMRQVLTDSALGVLPNVWLGTSVESSDYLWRLKHLRRTPASIRFVSFEPLLGPLHAVDLTGIHWAIVGGESGPHARPMDRAWVDDVRRACQEHGVAFFFKQWGGTRKKKAGRLLDGRTWDEYPLGSFKARQIKSTLRAA